MMVWKLLSFWETIFSGAFAASFREGKAFVRDGCQASDNRVKIDKKNIGEMMKNISLAFWDTSKISKKKNKKD